MTRDDQITAAQDVLSITKHHATINHAIDEACYDQHRVRKDDPDDERTEEEIDEQYEKAQAWLDRVVAAAQWLTDNKDTIEYALTSWSEQAAYIAKCDEQYGIEKDDEDDDGPCQYDAAHSELTAMDLEPLFAPEDS